MTNYWKKNTNANLNWYFDINNWYNVKKNLRKEIDNKSKEKIKYFNINKYKNNCSIQNGDI